MLSFILISMLLLSNFLFIYGEAPNNKDYKLEPNKSLAIMKYGVGFFLADLAFYYANGPLSFEARGSYSLSIRTATVTIGLRNHWLVKNGFNDIYFGAQAWGTNTPHPKTEYNGYGPIMGIQQIKISKLGFNYLNIFGGWQPVKSNNGTPVKISYEGGTGFMVGGEIGLEGKITSMGHKNLDVMLTRIRFTYNQFQAGNELDTTRTWELALILSMWIDSIDN